MSTSSQCLCNEICAIPLHYTPEDLHYAQQTFLWCTNLAKDSKHEIASFMPLSGETRREEPANCIAHFAISQGQTELTEAFRVASRAETGYNFAIREKCLNERGLRNQISLHYLYKFSWGGFR